METLKSARSRNAPWDEVARAVRRMETKSLDSASLAPIRRAEQLSGYSANQLRRMIAGLAFLEELAQTDPISAEWLGIPKFSHAEMLAKLWRRDRNATLRLLRSRPVLRYQNLSKLFDTMASVAASPMSAGKRAQKNFEERCLAVLLAKTALFAPFGAGSYRLLHPRVHHPYCRPALVLRAEAGAGRVRWGGLDFVNKAIWDDATLRQIMLIGVEARFLDLHFVFFPDGDAAGRAYHAIKELGFCNIRIAVLTGSTVGFFEPLIAEADQTDDRRSRWTPPRLSATVADYAVVS